MTSASPQFSGRGSRAASNTGCLWVEGQNARPPGSTTKPRCRTKASASSGSNGHQVRVHRHEEVLRKSTQAESAPAKRFGTGSPQLQQKSIGDRKHLAAMVHRPLRSNRRDQDRRRDATAAAGPRRAASPSRRKEAKKANRIAPTSPIAKLAKERGRTSPSRRPSAAGLCATPGRNSRRRAASRTVDPDKRRTCKQGPRPNRRWLPDRNDRPSRPRWQ